MNSNWLPHPKKPLATSSFPRPVKDIKLCLPGSKPKQQAAPNGRWSHGCQAPLSFSTSKDHIGCHTFFAKLHWPEKSNGMITASTGWHQKSLPRSQWWPKKGSTNMDFFGAKISNKTKCSLKFTDVKFTQTSDFRWFLSWDFRPPVSKVIVSLVEWFEVTTKTREFAGIHWLWPTLDDLDGFFIGCKGINLLWVYDYLQQTPQNISKIWQKYHVDWNHKHSLGWISCLFSSTLLP